MPRTSDKRERLVAAAKNLIQRQGYIDTSLAEIAKSSQVPLGNVYYYFKAKDDLAEAVIAEHLQDLHALLDECERENTDPKMRLRNLIDAKRQFVQHVARDGCPIGSLCQELNKHNSRLADKANAILNTELAWLREQLQAMKVDDAERLAQHLVARFQGASLLANSLGDPKVLSQELEHLIAWVDSL